MSFGFSVGDFLAGAQLAYTLSKALSDSHGASKQYQELIAELHVVHKVMLQVQELHAAKQMSIATVNALLFTINATNGVMEAFLDEHERYGESLKRGGSKNTVKDLYRKGRWATSMPEKVVELRNSLATMLAAVNCLLSLACYYKTEYNPRCNAELDPMIDRLRLTEFKPTCAWRDLRLEARLSVSFENNTLCLGFESQKNPASFFRPGQIFAAQITSNFNFSNERKFRKIDFGNLPLDAVSNLEAQADRERVVDRTKRLAQIRKLPLKQMTRYCRDLPGDEGKVECRLCSSSFVCSYPKDEWATHHFRTIHWQQYFGMLPRRPSPNGRNRFQTDEIIPWKKQKLPPRTVGSQSSVAEWIDLEHVTEDVPISTDRDIISAIGSSSEVIHYKAGPVMIQRFIVVRQGEAVCLCIGIHTYARRGCGSQPDQEMFGIISPTKTHPQPQSDETGMRLLPIRMRPDHPSTSLPSTARVHYRRAYEINHHIPVQPLGLIHSASMETFLDQFEAYVLKSSPEEDSHQAGADREDLKTDGGLQATDMNIVKDMREQITKVLGTKISPEDHTPSERVLELEMRSFE